jgi:glycosyltransferase involved in cell wall biosynthesis
VISQSAERMPALPLPPGHDGLDVISVDNLRDEKDPLTLLRAAVRLAERRDIRITPIGYALDPTLGDAVRRACTAAPSLRWLGGLPRTLTREHIQRSQLLVNTSRMEGGAHVILEAAQSGCAVAASRIAGNVGMLGPGHEGLFELGDDAQLARLIERAADERAFLVRLRDQTLARADLFEPAEEQRRLRALIGELLETPR